MFTYFFKYQIVKFLGEGKLTIRNANKEQRGLNKQESKISIRNKKVSKGTKPNRLVTKIIRMASKRSQSTTPCETSRKFSTADEKNIAPAIYDKCKEIIQKSYTVCMQEDMQEARKSTKKMIKIHTRPSAGWGRFASPLWILYIFQDFLCTCISSCMYSVYDFCMTSA